MIRSQSAEVKWQNLIRESWDQVVNGEHGQKEAIRRFQPTEIFSNA